MDWRLALSEREPQQRFNSSVGMAMLVSATPHRQPTLHIVSLFISEWGSRDFLNFAGSPEIRHSEMDDRTHKPPTLARQRV